LSVSLDGSVAAKLFLSKKLRFNSNSYFELSFKTYMLILRV